MSGWPYYRVHDNNFSGSQVDNLDEVPTNFIVNTESHVNDQQIHGTHSTTDLVPVAETPTVEFAEELKRDEMLFLQSDEALDSSVFTPYIVHELLGKGSRGRVYSLRVGNEQAPSYVGKVFRRREAENNDDFFKRCNVEFYAANQMKRRIDAPQISRETKRTLRDGTVLPQKIEWADVQRCRRAHRAIVITYPFGDSKSLLDFTKQRLDRMRSNTTRFPENGFIRTPEDRQQHAIWRWQVWRLGGLMCEIVGCLHELNIFHGDVKLENFVIANINPETTAITHGMLKIIDYGSLCGVLNFPNVPDDENSRFFNCVKMPRGVPYTATLQYADPRTIVVRPDLANAPRHGQKIRDVIELDEDDDRTGDVFDLGDQPVYFVVFRTAAVNRLWPEFDDYSVAASIWYLIDRRQRGTLYAANFYNHLPIKFDPMPTVKKGRSNEQDLIDYAVQKSAFHNILAGLSRRTLLEKVDPPRMAQRRYVLDVAFAVNGLKSAAEAFFELAIDWHTNYREIRDYFTLLIAQTRRPPPSPLARPQPPLPEPFGNIQRRSAVERSTVDNANFSVFIGSPEEVRGISISPRSRERRQREFDPTRNDDDDV